MTGAVLEAASSLCWVATVRSGRTVHSGLELQKCLFWLCRRTALLDASLNGHTETAMALVKVGADVHCQDNDGCGCSGGILVSVVSLQCGADGPSTRGGTAGVAVWLCRRTALHWASFNGHTATALALIELGAGMLCLDNDGYGFCRPRPRAVESSQCGADGPSPRGGAAGVPVLAVQADAAALGVEERPHGDGAGAGQGGRGRALQGQRRVRFSGCILVF
jgi:hypothetical protein